MKESRILVIALARVGDLLQSLPAISDLNRLSGGKGVAVVVQKSLTSLVSSHPAISRVFSFDGDPLLDALKREGWAVAGLDRLQEFHQSLLEYKPDCVVNLTHTPFAGRLASALDCQNISGGSLDSNRRTVLNGTWTKYFFTLLKTRSSNSFNLVDVYRGISAGERGEVEPLRIGESEDRFARAELARLPKKKRVFLGIGAHHPLRRWGTEQWIALGRILARQDDIGMVLVGDQGEVPTANEIQSAIGADCLNYCGKTNLMQLAALISHSDLCVGNDSGPLHLAASLGKPCLGIYLAMASPWETGPYSPGAVSVAPDLSCYPCAENSVCARPLCQQRISGESVAEIALNLIHRNQVPSALSDIVVRESQFDASGWCLLKGKRTPEDELRLVWREILLVILGGQTKDQAQVNLTHISSITLERLHYSIAAVLNQIENVSLGNQSQVTALNLLPRVPELIFRFPEVGTLLELYRLNRAECLQAIPCHLRCYISPEELLQDQLQLSLRLLEGALESEKTSCANSSFAEKKPMQSMADSCYPHCR
ncbi:MAG: glycosyltransferase family 9 protein [bacterium]